MIDHCIGILSILTIAGLVILAQTVSIPLLDPGMLSMFGTMGTGAVLVWYVVYDVRVRTPAMLKTFADEQAALRKAFEDEQKETHRVYSTIIEGLRQTFIVEQNATRQTFTMDQAAMRARHDKEVTELREMLFENLRSMRSAVNDVKDVAQSLTAKQQSLQET